MWAPVSGGVRSGSCSTREDDKGETRPKLSGEMGMWPRSQRMADGGGGGESATLGRGLGGWGKKGERRRPAPFMVTRGRGR
jgi:hypothetical protein